MRSSAILNNMMAALPAVADHHARHTALYAFFAKVARREIEGLFSCEEPQVVEFGPFGGLALPYHSMGAIDSLNLFDLDELIIFSFYWTNRSRYARALDIGANLGLHSILLSKCGCEVGCYEPDPCHFGILKKNMNLNNIANVRAFNMAVSNREGEQEFVRVLDNTTGSHLAGAKLGPYGDLERFPVKLADFRSLLAGVDLVKMDIEGHEKEVLLSTEREDWAGTDALVEVECEENALTLYEHFTRLGVHLFSQKRNWQIVRDACDVPTSYREGTLFVSCRDEMPWR